MLTFTFPTPSTGTSTIGTSTGRPIFSIISPLMVMELITSISSSAKDSSNSVALYFTFGFGIVTLISAVRPSPSSTVFDFLIASKFFVPESLGSLICLPSSKDCSAVPPSIQTIVPPSSETAFARSPSATPWISIFSMSFSSSVFWTPRTRPLPISSAETTW